MRKIGLLVLLVPLLLPNTLQAQGNLSSDSLSGSDESGQSGRSRGTTAQVGAGTDNGTTTGFSKPEEPGAGGGPPKIDASLCDEVDAGDAHADCLSKVLGSGDQK